MEYVARTSNGYVDVSRLFPIFAGQGAGIGSGIGDANPRMAPPEGGIKLFTSVLSTIPFLYPSLRKARFWLPEIRDTESFGDDPWEGRRDGGILPQ